VAAGEEGGLQEVGDHAGVVQGGAFAAVLGGVEAFEEIGPGGDGGAYGGAEGAHAFDPRTGGQGLVGDVEGHDHQRHAGFEHDISGFGVDVDVELGRGGDVAALETAAAHQDDLGHAGDDVGGALEGGGDVGEGAEGAEGDQACGVGAEGVDEVVDGVLVLQGMGRLGQRDAVEAGLAVDVFGGDELAFQGAVCACVDGGLVAAEFDDLAGVPLGEGQGHVPGDGGEGKDLKLRAGEGEEDGDGVVLAGVGVDDDLAGHGRAPLRGELAVWGKLCPDGQEIGRAMWDGGSRVLGSNGGGGDGDIGRDDEGPVRAGGW
jgi:hypothetical protein